MLTGKDFTVIVTMMLFLAGCSSQKGSSPPPPGFYPVFGMKTAQTKDGFTDKEIIQNAALQMQFIEPAAGMSVQEDLRLDTLSGEDMSGYKAYTDPNNAFKQIIKKDGCHIKDRFDRRAVLAYQWGRNRIGFDVDGIGFDSMDVEEVKMTYRLKLQPHISKRDKCRYQSSWQGMIGSGYNEFYKRENDTVMDRFSALRKEIKKRID